ncbi:MAG: 2-hydroxychromene-2-carboxylate isomerase [Lautropia sp.]
MAEPTDPARVQFLFDFGSPNAWMCHQLIPAIEARANARFDYVPILLGGLFKLANNRSPMEAFGNIPNKLAYERLERQRFIDAHGLSRFRMNPFFPVNTLKIMRLAVAAQAAGVEAALVDAMFSAMWEQQRNMDDAGEIEAVLLGAGLDATALLAASQSPPVKAALIANTQAAFERGAFGSPTFFIGDEMYFGKDRLRDVEEAVALR